MRYHLNRAGALTYELSSHARWIAPFKEIENSQAGGSSCKRSSTVIVLLLPLSSPASFRAVTRYCRWGTPLSWNVFELVSPRRPNEPLVEEREEIRQRRCLRQRTTPSSARRCSGRSRT